MMRWVLGLTALTLGCGPSYGGQGVKTPEEIVAEQEALGAEQEQASKGQPVGEGGETDMEKRGRFDKRQAELELKRAQRSAETCAGVVTEEGPSGEATVSLTFKNDGHVKEATISAPFAETAIGTCALRAMQAVIVPAFEGPDETIEWKLDLTAKEKEAAEPEKGEKKKK